jgi:hypothetical protein
VTSKRGEPAFVDAFPSPSPSPSPSPLPVSSFSSSPRSCGSSAVASSAPEKPIRYHWEQFLQDKKDDERCWHCREATGTARKSKLLKSTDLYENYLAPIAPQAERPLEILSSARIHNDCASKAKLELKGSEEIWNDPQRSWDARSYMLLRAEDLKGSEDERIAAAAKAFYDRLDSVKRFHDSDEAESISGNVTQSIIADAAELAPLLETLIGLVAVKYIGHSEPEDEALYSEPQAKELKGLSTPLNQKTPQAAHLDSLDHEALAVIVCMNYQSWSTMMSMFPARIPKASARGEAPFPSRYWHHFVQYIMHYGDIMLFRPTVVHMGPGNPEGSTVDEDGTPEDRWALFSSMVFTRKKIRLNKVSAQQLWEFLEPGKSLRQMKEILTRLKDRFTRDHLKQIAKEQLEVANEAQKADQNVVTTRTAKRRRRESKKSIEKRQQRKQKQVKLWEDVSEWIAEGMK